MRIPLSEYDFASLDLNPALIDNLASLGYTEMTPIQAQSLPHVLENKDIIARAKTGSGKTATFALGLLNKLDVKRFRVQTLVLCPTRELADQVATEIRKLARGIHNIKVLTLCGGVAFGPQVGSLEHGAHIIVGTPGRVEEHLRKANLNLDNLTTLVLDEADRMLDMGFQQALDDIVGYMPEQRQTMLFSATYPEKIENIAQRIMQSPVTVEVQDTHSNQSIIETLYQVENDQSRIEAVRLLLQEHQPETTLIFCNTKVETDRVANELCAVGYEASALHGDLEQKDRDQTLACFANRSISVLVATDVAARGLDIESLDMVINYQVAQELEVHTHRIGRTGRAGAQGMACSLYTQRDKHRISQLEDYLKQKFVRGELPHIRLLREPVFAPPMVTIHIGGGKKQKLRPGDIVGALTGADGIPGSEIGKIQVGDHWAYVGVAHKHGKMAFNKLSQGKLKGRSFRVKRLRG
ncbi:ATP-dependent RNA helicase DbpA [SAR92 clade bacterium H455]|uniref:ATP-dependent RNA helicase DbpA n=1 Tax=SAR92 clade bacterium H455 TaxID=2974818 RepID=A0ABY5TKD9_9GAMM|nr:ATP-dependent RNA helicase DbpA [SAR92 clade bacterium H455]